MDITPTIPDGRQVIESYGGGGFKVSGQRYDGSIVVLPERTLVWPVRHIDDATAASFELLDDLNYRPEILLLGCGETLAPVPAALRDAVRRRGMALEPMDSGAACRTYNVLLSEGRLVAAALIAIS
jgi:uncharacterized protein